MTGARAIATSSVLVIGLTGLGAALALLAPELAGTTPPHPTPDGGVGEAASIAAGNARVLVAPFALCLLDLPSSRLGRCVGDLLVLVLVALNTILVGLAVGRWRGQLLPYIPQLPVEWAALTIATAAWLISRDSHASRRRLAILAGATSLLLVYAAALETWCSPHTHRQVAYEIGEGAAPRSHLRVTAVPSATNSAPTPAMSLQGRHSSLPLTSVRFRSANGSTLIGRTSTTDPQEGSNAHHHRQRQPHPYA
jgi:hypothetical protein